MAEITPKNLNGFTACSFVRKTVLKKKSKFLTDLLAELAIFIEIPLLSIILLNPDFTNPLIWLVFFLFIGILVIVILYILERIKKTEFAFVGEHNGHQIEFECKDGVYSLYINDVLYDSCKTLLIGNKRLSGVIEGYSFLVEISVLLKVEVKLYYIKA